MIGKGRSQERARKTRVMGKGREQQKQTKHILEDEWIRKIKRRISNENLGQILGKNKFFKNKVVVHDIIMEEWVE